MNTLEDDDPSGTDGKGFNSEMFQDQELIERMCLTCPICLDVAKEVVESPCGHLFCRGCISPVLEKKSECPLDNKKVTIAQLTSSAHLHRLLLGLKVRCLRKVANVVHPPEWPASNEVPKACSWVGDLRNYDAHRTEGCELGLTNCGACQAGPLFRFQLGFHHTHVCGARKVSCMDCYAEFRHAQAQAHADQCPAKTVDCVDCHTPLKREQLATHRGQCPRAMVACSYARYGCEFRAVRGSLAEHVAAAASVHLALFESALGRFLPILETYFGELASASPSLSSTTSLLSSSQEVKRESASPADSQTFIPPSIPLSARFSISAIPAGPVLAKPELSETDQKQAALPASNTPPPPSLSQAASTKPPLAAAAAPAGAPVVGGAGQAEINSAIAQLLKRPVLLDLAGSRVRLFARGTGWRQRSRNNYQSCVYLNDVRVYSNTKRGLYLCALQRNDLSVIHSQVYDTHGSVQDSAAFAKAVESLNLNHLVVITSHDSWEGNVSRLAVHAMMYCGASELRLQQVMNAGQSRHPMVLIGIPGCGPGRGFELLYSSREHAPFADVILELARDPVDQLFLPMGVSFDELSTAPVQVVEAAE